MIMLHYVIYQTILFILVESQFYTLEYGDLTYPIKISEQSTDEGYTQDQNIYSYNINDYGIVSTTDNFIVGIWVSYGGYLYDYQMVMSLNYGLVNVYFYNYCLRVQYGFALYGSYCPMYLYRWFYVYYQQSITQNFQRVCIIEAYYNYQSFCYSFPQTNYYFFGFIQASYDEWWNYGLYNWQGSSISITAKLMDVNLGSNYAYFDFLTITSYEEPYVLLDIRLCEKRQFQSPKDWSDSQHLIQMGSTNQVDNNDPIYDIESQSLMFYGSQFLLINDFKIPKTITIEFQLFISDYYEYLLFKFRSVKTQYDVLYIYGSYNYIIFYSPYVDIGGSCYFDTSIKTIFAFIDLIDMIHVIFIQNSIILCEFTYNSGGGDLFQFLNVDQLLIGQEAYFSSNPYQLFNLRISKGFYSPASYLDQQICLYSINQCFQCLNGYFLYEGQCVLTCPPNYVLNNYKNQCVPECHPTCSTCSDDDPSYCLSCNGIRMNAPECTCPAGYFDDGITPECIYLIQDPSIDSGITEFQCYSSGNFLYQIYFSKQYRYPPKVIISLLGHIDYQNQREFQVFINEIQSQYFIMRVICTSSWALFKIQWMSGSSSNFLQSVQTDTSGDFTGFSTSFSNGMNSVICSILGWCIDNFNYYGYISMIFQRLSQNVFSFSGNYYFFTVKYQFFEFFNYQWYSFQQMWDFQHQFKYFSVGGSKITYQIQNIPQSIPNIVLLRGMYSYNTLPPQYWISEIRKLGYLEYRLKNFGYQEFDYFFADIIFTGQYCDDPYKSCNYVDHFTKCNQILFDCQCDSNQFYDANYNVCRNCNSGCLTCNIQPDNCLSCYTDQKFSLILNPVTLYNYCDCLMTQYFDGICRDCDSNCYQCEDDPTYCISCNPPAILNELNQCVCDIGYVQTENGCEQCVSPCATCETTTINCLTCVYSGQLIPTCACPTGQAVITTYCEQYCPMLCTSCINQSSCDSCVDNSLYNMIANVCECLSGYYSDGIGCQLCQSPCSTCISLTQCTGCDSTKNYLSAYTCYSCLSPCLDCNSSTSCLSCIDNTFYLLNNLCNTCISPCLTCNSNIQCSSCIDNTYYLDESLQCLTCINPCYQCNSSTYCLSCINTLYYLSQQNTCLNCISPCLNCQSDTYCIDCQIRYYLDSSNSCQLCINPCVECNNATYCLSCIDGYYLDADYTCQPCTAPCSQCITSSINCLSCVDLTMTITSGVCNCQNGYFYNSTDCQICHQTCTTCTTADNCCLSSNYQQLNVSTNLCECMNGYYLNSTTCTQCISPCNMCTSTTNCQNCIDGYYLSNSNCLACTLPCVTCINTTQQCLTCIGHNMILSNGSCICGTQFYVDSTIQDCVACHPTCQTCVDSSNCCFATEYKQLVGLVCECISGYFYDTNQICQKCDINCLTCQNQSTYCLTCDSTKTLDSNNKCQCTNTHQFIDTLNVCTECSTNCLTCETTLDNCLSCDQTKKLTLQFAQCKCLANEYLDNQSICQTCYKTCATCSNGLENGCYSCISSRILNPENRLCECKDGYYKNEQDECASCNIKCGTCINSNDCQTCAQNSSFNSDNTDCICDDGYFQNTKLQCQKCQPPCLTCTSALDCLSCQDQTREFIDSKCQCKKEYFENESQQCELCSSPQGKVNDICNYVNCGDGELTKGEECDDGNNSSRDGCSECKIDPLYTCINKLLTRSICFKCVDNCKTCSLKGYKSSCDQCYDGYFLKNNECIKCTESCYTCSDIKTCTQCLIIDATPDEKGVCPKCNDVKGFYIVNRKCVTKCGDAIVVDKEFCDDGNTVDGDGCNSKCEVEKYYSCKQSTCTKIPQDEVVATYVNSTTTDALALNFPIDQGNPCTKINITIDQFLETDFTANITFIQIDETQSKCDISFSFNKTIDVGNIIHILIPVKIKTQARLLSDEEVREVLLTPRKKVVYSQNQVKQAESASDAQSTLGELLYFIAPTAIVLGGFNFFWTIMDILSWINNLYYINIYFPENVRIFFQKSAWGDFQLIPAFFVLNQPDDPYYIESPKKFMEKGVDPIFLNNTWTCFAIIAITCGLFIISLLIVQLLELIWPQKLIQGSSKVKIFHLNESNNYSPKKRGCRENKFHTQESAFEEPKFQFPKEIKEENRFPYLIEKIYRPVNEFKTNFKSNLIKALNLAFLDLVLAIILQLTTVPSYLLKYEIVQINQILSYSSVGICVITLAISYYVTTKHHLLLDNKTFENQYGTLYECINTKSNTAMLYSFINLNRKALFIIVMVYFYYQPLLQTVFCCFISFLNVALILFENPFTSRADLIQNGIPDFCIFVLMLLSTGFAVDDIAGILDANQRFQIGWIMIGTIGLSIFTQVIFLLRQFIEDLIEKVKFVSKKINIWFKKK